MRILTVAAAVLATAAGSTAAFAADARLSDSQFVQVARCQGLAAGDAAKFDAIYKAQKRGRADFVIDTGVSLAETRHAVQNLVHALLDKGPKKNS